MNCGLIFYLEGVPVPVPLTNVDIKTKVVGFVAEVKVEQKYVNHETNPIEVVYMFPVEESAAVVNFEAEIDGRNITTKVKAKEEARKEYDKAIEDEKTAVLLEETTPDVFQIKVGQLKSEAVAKITLTYISELPVEVKAVRLTVPTTIAPRYVPLRDHSEAAKIIESITYSLDSPAPLTFTMEVVSKAKIKSVNSPSHGLETTIQDVANGEEQFTASSKLAAQTSDLDKDLVVLIETYEPDFPVVFVEKSDDSTFAGMVSLVPSFNMRDQKAEFVFVVDRSGSMSGYNGYNGTIEAAKTALLLFLHSLPSDCYFNIISFGSFFNSLFASSHKYDNTSLETAKSHVKAMSANYGGTEIYAPLQSIFKQPTKEGYLRQIFVLTDGEVGNVAEILQLVKKNCKSGRVFGLGLGASACRHLISGIARAGGGTALFAAENEDLRPKVMAQLKNALQPAITDIEVTWNCGEASTQEPEQKIRRTLFNLFSSRKAPVIQPKGIQLGGQAPEVIPPLYDGKRLLVYHLFPSTSKDYPKSVVIKTRTSDESHSVSLPVGGGRQLQGQFVHQLAARKRIQDLEEMIVEPHGSFTEKDIEKAITDLGIKYKLASKFTSFVGVDEKDPEKVFGLPMVTRYIDNQVPSGFGYFPTAQTFACVGSAPSLSGQDSCDEVVRSQHRFGAVAPGDVEDGAVASDQDSGDEDTSSNWEKAEAASQEMVKPLDTLTELIYLQASDGPFKWGDIIGTAANRSKEDLMSARPQFASEEVWLTAICIVLLEARDDEKDLWELVVLKARKFLATKLSGENVEKILEEAKNVVDTKSSDEN